MRIVMLAVLLVSSAGAALAAPLSTKADKTLQDGTTATPGTAWHGGGQQHGGGTASTHGPSSGGAGGSHGGWNGHHGGPPGGGLPGTIPSSGGPGGGR
ncbi:MAG TPA: hypothetical protein VMU01_06205, partial [Rhizomicrobium sp.]|nr:hypothetical protein [Rhizomicrobium sp.]